MGGRRGEVKRGMHKGRQRVVWIDRQTAIGLQMVVGVCRRSGEDDKVLGYHVMEELTLPVGTLADPSQPI